MEDVLGSVERWRLQGDEIGIATVVETWGSAPRPVGSKLAISLDGGIAGSVSAGCVEGAVIEGCQDTVKSGQPDLLEFGVADDEAWEVGLACGGEIKVFVEPFAALAGIYDELKSNIEKHVPMAVISIIDGPSTWKNRKLIVHEDGSTYGDLELPDGIRQTTTALGLQMLAHGAGRICSVEADEPLRVFVDVYPATPRLVIVGAVHIADSLVTIANTTGFETYVIDPRTAFATEERFPHATYLLREWPEEVLPTLKLDHSAYIVVLTHDPKFDDPTLTLGLQSNARYVGALGSRRTNNRRRERLRAAGLTEEQLNRLHAPIGVPLGGRSPAEIAISIMAEIIQAKNGFSSTSTESF